MYILYSNEIHNLIICTFKVKTNRTCQTLFTFYSTFLMCNAVALGEAARESP